jgi:hypothetical protein
MKKIKLIKKLASLTLIGGGVLPSLPLIISSCSCTRLNAKTLTINITNNALQYDDIGTATIEVIENNFSDELPTFDDNGTGLECTTFTGSGNTYTATISLGSALARDKIIKISTTSATQERIINVSDSKTIDINITQNDLRVGTTGTATITVTENNFLSYETPIFDDNSSGLSCTDFIRLNNVYTATINLNSATAGDKTIKISTTSISAIE